MKFLSVVSITLLVTFFSGCQTDNLLGLDDSAITVLAINKKVDETNRGLTKVMQASGYEIDKTESSVLEFRRGIKGVLAVLSTSERLQQEDVVNCVLIDQEDGTLISCRTYLESVNRKGHERRTEKTQAIGYRTKLEKELSAINDS